MNSPESVPLYVLFTHMSIRLFLNLHSGFPSPRACLTLQPALIISGKTPILTVINFRGISGSPRICGPHPGRKDRRFGETGKKGRLTCARTLSFTTEDVSVFILFNRSDKCHSYPSGYSHVVTSDLQHGCAESLMSLHDINDLSNGRVTCSHPVKGLVVIRDLWAVRK